MNTNLFTIILIITAIIAGIEAQNTCLSPCNTCQINNTTSCSTCISGYTLFGNYCVSSSCHIVYCSVCYPTAATCAQCLTGFVLTNNTCSCQTNFVPSMIGSPNATCICSSSTSSCISCSIGGCLTCINSTFCSVCAEDFSLNGMGGCIMCNISNCISCIVNNFCQVCNNNYTVGQFGQCAACNTAMAGCTACYGNTTCSCGAGYYQSYIGTTGNINQCNACLVSGCLSCRLPNVCQSCQTGYTINNPFSNNVTCIYSGSPICQFPCSFCLSNGSCSTCFRIYSYYPANGNCFLCNVANCNTCNSVNTYLCASCNVGYLLSNNGSLCVLNSIPNCYNFSFITSTCIQCNNFFTLQNGVCSPCLTGPACISCLSSNLSICLTCTTTSYLSNGQCIPCSPICATCDQNGCLAYNLNPNVILINGQLYIEVCPSTCYVCSSRNPAYCTSCNSAFYLVNGNCLPCNMASNCFSCAAVNPNSCLSCFPSNVMVIVNENYICQTCIFPCQTCGTNLSSCTSCPAGYYLFNNSCNNCPINCAACTSSNVCNLCIPGYFPYYGNGTCLPGSAGCFSSLVYYPSICQGCMPGTFMNIYTLICNQCPPNCLNCATLTTCRTCLNGYYPSTDPNNVCAPNCILPCAACLTYNSSICTACIAGYVYSSLSPTNCKSLYNCSYGCSVCPLGYSLNTTQQCVACGATCASCMGPTPNVCLSCFTGMWLNNIICSLCPSGCFACTNPLQCSYCSSGFVQNNYNVNGIGASINACIPCQSPCVTCNASPNLCLTCITGYIIFGTQCVNIYNYIFSVNVQASSMTFYGQYQQFVNILIGAVNSSNYGIFFPTVTLSNSNSSFIFTGKISSLCIPQSACSNTEYNQLQSVLNQSSIANMTILSSYLSYSNGSAPAAACVSPCSTCTIPGGSVCASCISGFQFINGICVNAACPYPYCQTCYNNSCVQCLPTFIIVNNTCQCQTNFAPSTTSLNATCICPAPGSNILASSCISCQISNCLSCLNSSFCSQCTNGATQTSSGGCILCRISNCSSCLVNNFCQSCSGNLVVSSIGTCVQCSAVFGCNICNDNNNCAQCAIGYSLVMSNGLDSCIGCFISNCQYCNQFNFCQTCSQGFILVNNTCTVVPCSWPCATCNTNGDCITCINPAYSVTPNNSSCYICNVINCMICNATNTSQCTQCMSGFTLVATSAGSPPSICITSNNAGCQAYSSSSNNNCLFCQLGYSISNGFCYQCSNTQQACLGCSISNLSSCNLCAVGFYLSNGSCYACPPFCSNCNATSCFAINTNAIVINNQVYVEACQWPCQNCMQNNPAYCILCEGGFYSSVNGNCMPCSASSNCQTCSSITPQVCDTCFNYGFLSTINQTSICQYCSYPCLTCAGTSNNCTSCAVPYLYANNSCIQINCSQYCLICNPSGCAACMSGYFAYNGNGTCLPGMIGCSSPFIDNPNLCLQCAPGMVLTQYTSICVQCPTNCQQCTVYKVCTLCYEGFYLTANQNIPCAPVCQYPCSTCSYTNASLCLACIAGYIYNSAYSNQCQPLNNCSPSCVVCPMGYALGASQQCIACNQVCVTCIASSPQFCLSCATGQYVTSSGLCSICLIGCSTCINNLTCLSCSNGYIPQSVSFNSAQPQVSLCILCSASCLTCLFVPNFCISCNNGYSLLGSQCLNNFNYYINITVQANSTQFYQNYPAFTAQLISPFNILNSLGLGIIFVKAKYQFPNANYAVNISSQCFSQTLCSQRQYNNLNSLLQGNAIGNMTIISYTLKVNGGNPFPPNNTNPTCQLPCSTCNTTQGTCASCISGYQVINGYCYNSNCRVMYCSSCSNVTTCKKCNQYFILSNNSCICQTGWSPTSVGNPSSTCFCNSSNANSSSSSAPSNQTLCIVCNVNNCLSCTKSSTCSNCAAPYTLNNQSLCVNCNIDNCLMCSSNNFCSNCGGGLSVATSGDRCLLCTNPFCFACSSPNVCASCQSGYFFDTTGATCITCSLANCLQCQGNNLCSQCAPGYILSNFTCIFSNCSFPCLACNADNTCANCYSPPFVSIPGLNNTCYSCNVSNCINCSFSNPSVCITCVTGYSVSSNGSQCLSTCSQTSCLTCSTPSNCQTCAQSYVVVQGQCQSCATGCSTCSSNNVASCSFCQTGFFLNGTSCITCPSYCISCSTSNVCLQFVQSSGQSLVLVNGILAACDQGCQQCSQNNPNTCLQCLSGYYLLSSVCLPCTLSSNCQTCNVNNFTQCLTCFSNSFFNNGICSSCNFPCVSCQSTNQSSCLSCPSGYLLSNSSCFFSQCPIYCSLCSSNSICLQCINGYVPYSGNCVPCLTGCSSCSTVSPGLCLACTVGTYLDTVSQQCLSCSANCKSCLPNGCTVCMGGYYLTSSLMCAANCIPPCATCSTTSPINCLSCMLGYIFNSTVLTNCSPDVSCSATFSCSSCPLGFVFSNLQCIACKANCARCSSTSNSTCTSCYNAQYLNSSSQCASCPTGCAICISKSTCLTCANGYTSLTLSSVNNPSACARCISPCALCQGSPNVCTGCVSGYTLGTGKCISNFNFGFNVTLSVTAIEFYSNYVAFLTALANNVNSSYGAINLQLISPGSIKVQGTISTNSQSGTTTSQSQYQGLQQTLATNSKIAGMTIVSSSVNPNGGSADVSSTTVSNSWVIIVSVVVPIVFLILAATGIFIYCRRRRLLLRQPQLTVQFTTAAYSPYEVQLQTYRF